MERQTLALIGFGEAAQAFAEDWAVAGLVRCQAFDIKTGDSQTAAAKWADYERLAVTGCARLEDALDGADIVLSLVTADQALDAARQASLAIGADALFCDMNSVAPDTKRAAAKAISAAGARYADVAVMAPVHPARLKVPLLVSGPHAEVALRALSVAGFGGRRIEGDVGAASAIKMIRSIMVKGLESLTAECLLSARAVGVEDEVIASLDASFAGASWRERGDYNLERMLAHGLRRAAEMREAAATARSLGLLGVMAAATAEWQERLGSLVLSPIPEGLDAKADAILTAQAISAEGHHPA